MQDINIIAIWGLLVLFLYSCSVYGRSDHRDKVVVIDTGINRSEFNPRYKCADGDIDLTGEGIHDYIGHGTNVAGLISKHMDYNKECLIAIKAFPTGLWNWHLVTALKLARQLEAKFVNMSYGGISTNFAEEKAISELLSSGADVMTSAGNNRLDLSKNCVCYPACYKFKSDHWHVVGATDLFESNFNGPVNELAKGNNQCYRKICMSGTSQACANVTGRIIELRRKHDHR
jgi:subtilisin family serine protease